MRVVATTLLALALSTWSAVTIVIDHHAAPIRTIAEHLEADPRKPRDLAYFARIEQGLREDEWCARETVQSNVTIRLAILDASFRSEDSSRQAAALAKARATLRHGLLCFPRDGNFWLRLAMVEYAQSGATKRVGEMLKGSRASAPSEGWIMIPRISFASRLRSTGPASIEDVLQADVHDFLSYARVGDIVSMYVSGDEQSREVLTAGIKVLDRDRKITIERAVEAALPEQDDPK